MQFYQHSGRCGFWGVPIAAACGILASLVLGIAYVYLVNWIPLVYVSFLATLAYGFAIGMAVVLGARVGKIRNALVATLVGGLVGLVAVYTAWVYDPVARLPGINGPVWRVETLWEYMKFGYEHGFWTIGRNGQAVTGVFLAAVWVAEAAIIVGVAGATVHACVGHLPFCEETNQWTKAEKKVAQLSLVHDEDAEAKLKRLVEGDLTALAELTRAIGDEPSLLQLDLATCPDCPTCNYLTMKIVQSVTNKKGEVSKQEVKLLEHLQVAPEDVPAIRAAGVVRAPEPPAPADAAEPA